MIMSRLVSVVAWLLTLLGIGLGVGRWVRANATFAEGSPALVSSAAPTPVPPTAAAKRQVFPSRATRRAVSPLGAAPSAAAAPAVGTSQTPAGTGSGKDGIPMRRAPIVALLRAEPVSALPAAAGAGAVWPPASLRADPGGRSVTGSAAVAPDALPPPRGAAAAIEVAASPHSMQIVTVPVPAELASDGRVQYTIVPVAGARILPPFDGVAGATPVVVTADVPAGTPAGSQPVAWVEFRQGGTVRQRVPVRLKVTQAHGATLRLAQSVLGARAGDRVPFRYFLTNTGNGRDTIDLRVVLPSGWRVEGLPTRQILEAGATITADVLVLIPQTSGDGSLRLRFVATLGGREVAAADATIQVIREGMLTARGGGPQLTVGVASVLTDQATASPVVGFDLQGPLTSDLRVSGRLVQPTDRETADALALTRVGYYLGGSYLSVGNDRWSATAGSSGWSFSEITGMNVYARGGAFTYNDAHWTADALAGAPASGDVTGTGHLYGARVGAKLSGGWVGVTATDLLDEQFQMRELQAFGLGGVTPPFSGWTATGELAERHYAGGSGLGWITQLDQRSGSDYAQLRAMQAPGGTVAFARTSQELSGTVSHGFGPRVVVGGGAWVSDDQNPAYSKLRSTGWSVSPQYRLSDHASLLAEVRASGYTAKGTVGEFGNSDRALRLGATVHYGTVYGIGSVIVGDASRSTALPSAPSVTTTADRFATTGTVGWITPHGTVEANLAYERSGPGVGYLPEQASATVRAQRVSVMADGGGPLLHGEVQYYSYFGTIPAVTVVRVGVDQPLPGELLLTVDAEHNPLLTGRDAGWVPVVKLEHVLHLPGVTRARVHGIVYEDRNGNGIRDRGEPGVRGVVVRRDGEVAVTDGNGEFTFPAPSPAPVRIDETSLPFGLVANPATSGRTGAGPLDIGIWPTAAVTVRLVPTADSTGRVPHANLRAAGVRAVDAQGNSWSAVVDSLGTARFDALPPGTYQIELDLGGVREPVHVRGALPTFQVVPGRSVPVLSIPLLPRPIRMFDPSKQTGRGAARPEGRP